MTEVAGEPSSLLDWVAGLASDPVGRARLTEDPRTVLTQQGLADLSPVDVQDALPLVTDVVATRLGVDVDARDVAVLRPGEDPASALGRQFGGVADRVLGVEVPAEEAPDPYDDLDAGGTPDDVPDDPTPTPQDHDLDDLEVPGPGPDVPDEAPPDTGPPDEAPEHAEAEVAEVDEAGEITELHPPDEHDEHAPHHEHAPHDHGPDPVDQFDDLL